MVSSALRADQFRPALDYVERHFGFDAKVASLRKLQAQVLVWAEANPNEVGVAHLVDELQQWLKFDVRVAKLVELASLRDRVNDHLEASTLYPQPGDRRAS